MQPATPTLTPNGPASPPPDPTLTERRYCPTCDNAGVVYRRVPFGHPLFGRATPCPACEQGRSWNRDALWDQAGIGPVQRDACTFAAFDRAANPAMHDAAQAAERWADGDGSPFLVLASADKGIGKTHLAIAAAGRCIDRDVPVRYRVVARLLDELRETQRPDAPQGIESIRRRIVRYPALILDEFGRGAPTDWADRELFTLLDGRYAEHMRTLIVTNSPPSTWDSAIRSRLLDTRLSRVVACQGSDYRLRSTTGTARQPLGPTLGVGALPRVPAEDGVERLRGVSA